LLFAECLIFYGKFEGMVPLQINRKLLSLFYVRWTFVPLYPVEMEN